MEESGLKRLTDLFVEGTEAFLGEGPDGPVVIWMNKLNSFEVEEAGRDGVVRRSERMAELGPDSAEVRGTRVQLDLLSDAELREAIVADEENSVLVEAFNNLRMDADFRELEDYVQRAPTLLADEDVKPGDPRFATLEEKTRSYGQRLDEEIANTRDQHIKDLSGVERPKLEAKFWEGWRQRRTMDEYFGARRTTELFLSARKCDATLQGGGVTLAGEMIWDHSKCDHSQRFFSERASLHKVPDGAMTKMVEAYESLRIRPDQAGNLDAPASSSASSEPSSAPEEASSPSSPGGTHAAAPTT